MYLQQQSTLVMHKLLSSATAHGNNPLSDAITNAVLLQLQQETCWHMLVQHSSYRRPGLVHNLWTQSAIDNAQVQPTFVMQNRVLNDIFRAQLYLS